MPFSAARKALLALVVGEDIWLFTDRRAGGLPDRQVDGEQGGVVRAGNEREPR
ncbi:hypothetical protein [Rhodococcus opacus]|uniref:hypothetical protein n=1 Tax=Rhodococcus opacus TaxID=37919 RepID=UPI0034D1FCDC